MIDASVAAAWYVPAQATPAATTLLQRGPADDWRAPYCFTHEIANLILRQERRGSMRSGGAEAVLSDLQTIGVEVEPAPTSSDLGIAIQLARRHEVSLFDAFYLHLSLTTAGALVSRDGPLLTAAVREGCKVFDVRIAT